MVHTLRVPVQENFSLKNGWYLEGKGEEEVSAESCESKGKKAPGTRGGWAVRLLCCSGKYDSNY